MFKISWDKESGGVRLSSKIDSNTLGISPRPVFFEELDLLKLDKLGWKYPRCQKPLLWACNKQYFYRGELMFEAKGANVYDPATVVFQEGKETAELVPVDVKEMLERCKNEMFLLETEAIEFIRDTYLQYVDASKKVDTIKANQVDFETLVSRVSKDQKKQMAIVKQDCDSFDIMPLEEANTENFWKNNSLGSAQVDAMKIWLKDAEIIDKKNIITPLGAFLKNLYENNRLLVWEITMIQLLKNSYVIQWFANTITNNQEFDKKTLCELISTSDAPAAKTTLDAAIGALIQLFKYSPVGEDFGFAIQTDSKYIRHYYSDLSREAVAYSLYKFAENQGIKTFRVSDLYNDECKGGPYREFGIGRADLEKALRSLNSENNRVLTAELNMGLDHISLREDLDALSALEILTK